MTTKEHCVLLLNSCLVKLGHPRENAVEWDEDSQTILLIYTDQQTRKSELVPIFLLSALLAKYPHVYMCLSATSDQVKDYAYLSIEPEGFMPDDEDWERVYSSILEIHQNLEE